MRGLILALLLCLTTAPAWAYYPWEMLQGDRALGKGDTALAMQHYQQALAEKPEDSAAVYNIGVCHYREGEFEKAAEQFQLLVDAKDRDFIGRAAYNLGNAQFRLKKKDEALKAYKTALRWDELDDDARYNIQLLLDDKKKQQQQQQQKDQQQKPKDQKSKDQQKDKDQKKDDQDKNQKDEDKDQDKDQDKDGDQDKKDQQGDQDKDKDKDKDDQKDKGDPNQDPGGQQQPTGMSQEDAERLLRYFQQKEEKSGKKGAPIELRPPRGTEIW